MKDEKEGCGCRGWQKNISKVEGPMVLNALRMGGKGYDGEPFKFCPWCGTPLPIVQKE